MNHIRVINFYYVCASENVLSLLCKCECHISLRVISRRVNNCSSVKDMWSRKSEERCFLLQVVSMFKNKVHCDYEIVYVFVILSQLSDTKNPSGKKSTICDLTPSESHCLHCCMQVFVVPNKTKC